MATQFSLLTTLLTLIGAITLAIFLYRIAAFFALYLLPSSLPRYRHAGTRSWALVTGASDGIGRAIAEELGRAGFAVLLHGRNPAKLDAVRDEIQQSVPGAQLDVWVADAARCREEDFAQVRARVEALGEGKRGVLTVLVNNVGGVNYTPRFKAFAEMEAEEVETTVGMNARFPTRLTHALMPVLRRNRPSLVINIGSMAGVVGAPYRVMYAASKAYNLAFSAALQAECEMENAGVEVLGLLVGEVWTNNNPIDYDFFTADPPTFARAALARVGCGERVVNAYFWHAVQSSLLYVIPEKVALGMVKKIMKEKREDELKELKAR